jgi:phage/plasmid-associated DNA primase
MYIGIGQNGKSVLINLMEHVLGEYKGNVPLTLITQQRTKIGGVSPEIVQLKGIRYAVMQEPSKGDKINEGIMKQLSAGDDLSGRAPYMSETISFKPQFKLVVCSNEFLEIKTQDHGTWRRIRVVDFESLFTENPKQHDPEKPYQFKLDKNITEKFGRWKEVFASMLVNIVFKTSGNVPDCEKVMSSSNSYRQGQDIFSEYLQDKIMKHPNGCITKGQLSSDFNEWYSLNYGSGKRPNVKDLTSAMDKKYCKNIKGIWNGVKFSPNPLTTEQTYNNEDNDDSDTEFNEIL